MNGLDLWNAVEAIHAVRVRLWFRREDGSTGHIEDYGTTKLAYWAKPRSGPPYLKVDEEACKKSLSDAKSKLFVALGGSAQVWLGEFDRTQHKYMGRDDDRQARAPKPEHVTARPSGKVALSYAGAEEPEPVAGEPTFLLDGARLSGEDWIAAAVLTAKRLQPSAMIVWWEQAKEERAKLHKQRPDLNDTLDKLKAKVLAKAETFNGTNNGAGHVTPDQALRAG
jgi:hypothetical protein